MRVRMLVLSAFLAVPSCAIMLALQASPSAKFRPPVQTGKSGMLRDPMGEPPNTGRARDFLTRVDCLEEGLQNFEFSSK
jgi:hypothetical protein